MQKDEKRRNEQVEQAKAVYNQYADPTTRKQLAEKHRAPVSEAAAPTLPHFGDDSTYHKAELWLTKPAVSVESLRAPLNVMQAPKEMQFQTPKMTQPPTSLKKEEPSHQDFFSKLARQASQVFDDVKTGIGNQVEAAKAGIGNKVEVAKSAIDAGLAKASEQYEFLPSSLAVMTGGAQKMHVRIAEDHFDQGGMRLAFHGQIRARPDEEWRPVIYKTFIKNPQFSLDDDSDEEDEDDARDNLRDSYLACAEASAVASFLAKEFNREKKPSATIKFIESSVITIKLPGVKESHYFVEEPLPGEFVKYTSNHEGFFDQALMQSDLVCRSRQPNTQTDTLTFMFVTC